MVRRHASWRKRPSETTELCASSFDPLRSNSPWRLHCRFRQGHPARRCSILRGSTPGDLHTLLLVDRPSPNSRIFQPSIRREQHAQLLVCLWIVLHNIVEFSSLPCVVSSMPPNTPSVRPTPASRTSSPLRVDIPFQRFRSNEQVHPGHPRPLRYCTSVVRRALVHVRHAPKSPLVDVDARVRISRARF